MLRWLERRLDWLAVPNVTLFLICGQILTFFVAAAQPTVAEQIVLYPELVRQGEVWRLLTFVFMAPLLDPTSPFNFVTILFFIIQMQLLWLFGRALEEYWGTLRYNLFLLTGYLATVAGAFAIDAMWQISVPATNGFLYGTVFLAFAFLFPDFVMRLFFILPIRIKWLALATWILYGVMFAVGNGMVKVLIFSSVANWLLYFWRDVLGLLRVRSRSVKRKTQAAVQKDEPFHRCVVCGRTEKTDPQLEFRYARALEGVKCYCLDHVPTTAGKPEAGNSEPAGRIER